MLTIAVLMTACGTDNDVDPQSIFDTSAPARNSFDQWLLENYTNPYNISFIYKYQDSETNNSYNVVPPSLETAKTLAIIIKHVWIDAYNECMQGVFGADGTTFMKTYAPRIIFLLGSHQYRTSGERVLGTAEGGLKVTLFGTNEIDTENLFIDQESSYPDTDALPIDLNYWFFHTMHHEFCHIMTQKKSYDTSFQDISAAHQRLGDWINMPYSDGPKYGFVSNYASSEYNEDFAEIFATYVTLSEEAWNGIIADAKKYAEDSSIEARSETADSDILNKLEIVKKYFNDTWGLDMDKMRDIVLRRSNEVVERGVDLDRMTLKNATN